MKSILVAIFGLILFCMAMAFFMWLHHHHVVGVEWVR